MNVIFNNTFHFQTDKFCRYDFGPEKNLEIYGQEEPPEYDVTQITAPVALYWSDNDWLAEPVVIMNRSLFVNLVIILL